MGGFANSEASWELDLCFLYPMFFFLFPRETFKIPQRFLCVPFSPPKRFCEQYFFEGVSPWFPSARRRIISPPSSSLFVCPLSSALSRTGRVAQGLFSLAFYQSKCAGMSTLPNSPDLIYSLCDVQGVQGVPRLAKNSPLKFGFPLVQKFRRLDFSQILLQSGNFLCHFS